MESKKRKESKTEDAVRICNMYNWSLWSRWEKQCGRNNILRNNDCQIFKTEGWSLSLVMKEMHLETSVTYS